MTHPNEIETFREVWNSDAENTIRLLEVLPIDKCDFRPDPHGALDRRNAASPHGCNVLAAELGRWADNEQ